MLYAIAHECVPALPGYRQSVAGPLEPDLHSPTWSEIQALNRILALTGVRRFRGVRYSFRRIRDLGRLSPLDIRTLVWHPDERVPLAVLHAIRDADFGRDYVAYDRRRFIGAAVAERGQWLETLGAHWNPIYDALVALDLAGFAPVPPRSAIDALGPWVDSVGDPRALETAFRFRYAPLLEFVASRIRCADRAFVEAIVNRAPVAGPAFALNPHVDAELLSVLGLATVMRLRSLGASDERVPGVAEWVAPFLRARRNLLATLCAVRERQGEPTPEVMLELVHDANLDHVRSVARTPVRSRVARQALLALGFPLPHDVAESAYPEYAASLRAEMIRWPDWRLAPTVSKRFQVLAQAVRDIEFPIQAPYALYAPRNVTGPITSTALERGAMLAAISMVRALTRRAFRNCLVQLARTGPQTARRLCELATREQLKSITRAFVHRLVPPTEALEWRHVLSLLPAARRDIAIRQQLIERPDAYIARQLLPALTPDEQRRLFRVLSMLYPADALAALQHNIGDIRRALHPTDLADLLDQMTPEVRVRTLTLLHTVQESPCADQHAVT